MTQQEKYNLTWHTYTDHLREMMRSLVTDTAFADVTLISEDKKYMKAHKNVLSFCSPTFKEIFTLDHSSSVIYLRGVNHSELESILLFIYLGEATFPPDRMNDFFSAGKSLQIKELTNDFEPENVPTSTQENKLVAEEELQQNQEVKSKEQCVEQNIRHNKCNQCDKVFAKQSGLDLHIKSVHERVRYDCSECQYQGTTKPNLNAHIRSKHENHTYNCKQCDFKSNWQIQLKEHVESKHEGVKYKCNQCSDSYEYSSKAGLRKHFETVHKGVKYQCNHCNHQASERGNLYKHIRTQHGCDHGNHICRI